MIKKLFKTVIFFPYLFKINKYISVLKNEECLILGNGPSLEYDLKNNLDFFLNKTIFCVNNFAENFYFNILKPKFYIITDSLYWENIREVELKNTSLNKTFNNNSSLNKYNFLNEIIKMRQNLFDNLINKTNWKLILFVPIQSKNSSVFESIESNNKHINIIYYSTIPINRGPKYFRFLFYSLHIGIPSPQSVLIAAIIISLRLKFKKIILFGCDHSSHENVYLDNNNILFRRNDHFYDHNVKKSLPLVKNIKSGDTTTVSEFFYSLYLLFRSHNLLHEYSLFLNSKIINCSNQTWIDSYERNY